MEIIFWEVPLVPAPKNNWPNVPLPPLLPCPSTPPAWHPDTQRERTGRTLAHYFTEVPDLWTEIDFSTLRKLVSVWCGTVVRVTTYFFPFAESHVFPCDCYVHFNWDFMFHTSLNVTRVNALTPIFWECLPLSVRRAMVLHPFPSHHLWLCPTHTSPPPINKGKWGGQWRASSHRIEWLRILNGP